MENTQTNLLEQEVVERSADLRDQVKGKVYVAGDPGYDEARQGWNLAVRQTPVVIVDVTSVEDVQAAVRFASNANLPIGVMTTGHGLPRSCDRGVLIRTGAMNSVTIDGENRLARIQGGAQWKDVLVPAQEAGFAALSGSAPHVGVVGYTLGGGFGLLMRKYGLAVDSVRSMQVVLSNGEVVTASADENDDLFWALLGGGGAFGVITEIVMALYPEPQVFGGAVIYPADRAEELCLAYREWTEAIPDDVTSSFVLVNFPPLPFIPEPLQGRAVAMITACVGGDLSKAEALVAPMREMGGAMMDSFGTFGYADSGQVYRDPVDPLPAGGQGVMLKNISAEKIRQMIAAVGPVGQSPNLQVQFRHLGGAVSRTAHGTTAVGPRREAEFLVYCLGVPNPMATPAAMDSHAKGIFAALGDSVLCRGPLNFLGEGHVGSDAIREVFAQEDFARLCEVKRKYDPANRFQFASVGICHSEA